MGLHQISNEICIVQSQISNNFTVVGMVTVSGIMEMVVEYLMALWYFKKKYRYPTNLVVGGMEMESNIMEVAFEYPITMWYLKKNIDF